MSHRTSLSDSLEDLDEDYSRGRRSRTRYSDSGSDVDSADDMGSIHPPSTLSYGLVGSDNSMPELPPLQKPWLYKRHLTNGNPSPFQAKHNRFHQWRLQDKLKTGNGAIVVCLNLDVDPPDVVKTQPCAVLEGWIDPRKLGSAKALEAIGKNLCQQFQSLNARIKYKPFLDPSIDEARRFCVNLRKTAKDERLCFYYNGHGVPKPTSSGELWVFNKNYSQYIPVSLFDLQTWLGSPVIYVWDCSAAGNLVQNFLKYAHKRDEEMVARHGGNLDGSPPHAQAIQLAACLAHETLSMAPDMPADMFTSCLTSPIEMALRFYYLHQTPPDGVTMEMLHEVPGDLKDRRTPLGELNWIFTGVTDTIAWTSFPRPIFKRLFRQDLLVAALFRNFLLAERIMRNYHCTPHTIPALPSTAAHPLWAAWDRSVEDIIKQLPDLLKSAKPPQEELIEIMDGRCYIPTPFKYEYKSSSFFADHLTAFEHWMSEGGGALTKIGTWSMTPLEEDLEEDNSTVNQEEKQPDLVPRKPPAQLPILLQVLLSQAHRMRALTLLCQFVDLGPWAVHLVLEIGIYPYVQKLLLSPQADLKPLLIFIWSRLIAFDRTCQVDLLRDGQFSYFALILDYSNPVSLQNTGEHRAMCAFIIACLCRDHHMGQVACLTWNQGALPDLLLYHLQNAPDFLLKQWSCLALAQLWDNNDEAKELTSQQNIPTHLCTLLQDDVAPEVRTAALYALGTFFGASGSVNPDQKGASGSGRMSHLSEPTHLRFEFDTVVDAIKATKMDASPIVRKEAVVLLSAIVNEWRGYFVVAAWIYWEEDKRNEENTSQGGSKSDNNVAERALRGWLSNLHCSSDRKKQHRQYLDQIFLMLTYLYDLVVDPHIEVATMATTVVDFIVAMLLESPFSRIHGTTVRGPRTTPNTRTRNASSASNSASISRQPSLTNLTPSTLNTPLQPLQRTDSAPQVPTRSSFPGLIRTSSIASAIGTLAGFAMGTPSGENTTPSSPSQSHYSDAELPPAPSFNIAQYVSPYGKSQSSEASVASSGTSTARATFSIGSTRPGSPTTNGNGHATGTTQPTSKFTPADVISAMTAGDLIKFAQRRGEQTGHLLWKDFDIDRLRLEELEDLGLNAGDNLNQTLPLKSRFYDWCLEYYKEPQMRQLDDDEPGSLPYTRQLWRRERDDALLKGAVLQGQRARVRPWTSKHANWKIPFAPMRMTFHQFDPHVAISDEGAHVSVYDWRSTHPVSGFNNGNPKGTSITSLHFVNEDSGGALVVGSSDGVVRIYNDYDPRYGDGKPVQLVSGFRALPTMIPATRGAGIVSNWNQPLGRLLCGGDSDTIYEWDALSERCVSSMETEENCPLTSIVSNPYSRRTFIGGFGNGAVKVFDTRARNLKSTIKQNRREHRAWIANVRYQTGSDRQILSASVDGRILLWDLRRSDGIVQSWEAFSDGLASFDVHPNSDVFIASSTFSRSWRNQEVALYTFTPIQQQPRPSGANVSAPAPPAPILSTSFPTGLTAPSRVQMLPSNIQPAQSCLVFHPIEMFFALGMPDGRIRLQGCNLSDKSDKQFIQRHYTSVAENGSPAQVPVANGYQNGTPTSNPSAINFPSMAS